MNKILILLLNLIFFMACTSNESGRQKFKERFKTRKSTPKVIHDSSNVITSPPKEKRGPFVKGGKASRDTSQKEEVISKEREKMSSPEYKNKKP